MKQIHIIYGSVLAALLAIVPTIVLAQIEVPSGLSIASVNVSQDPITHGSNQEVSVAVVDNSADASADGVDVMLTVSYASGMEKILTESTDQNGNADFVFPIGASSKPGTFNIVAEIPGSNISEDESFEVILTTSEEDTTSEGDSERSTTSSGSTTSE
jgi:5-hydroxyisourate hydrolase-like protein (transthyretin family)